MVGRYVRFESGPCCRCRTSLSLRLPEPRATTLLYINTYIQLCTIVTEVQNYMLHGATQLLYRHNDQIPTNYNI